MKTGIYMIRNKVNNKAYIGQAVDIDVRWATHINELNGNKHINRYLQNAWNKYGADNFEFTIICQCLEQDLDRLEIHYIAHYHTFYRDGGYNLTLGGGGSRGYKHTDEQRAKMSEAIKEAMNRPEVRKKHLESVKEYFKDPEVKKKRSEAMKGDKNPMKRPEVKAKISEALKGIPKSEEHKARLSEAKKGRPSPNRKAVYCVTNDTSYASGKVAGEKLGIDPSCIGWCCNGKNINKKYPDGHHHKKGLYKDSPVYEFWYLSEYEEKFGKVAM